MNSDDCRNRADEWLAAAQYASDRDAQRTWRQLADIWLLWSEHLRVHAATNLGSASINELRDGARPAVAAEPNKAEGTESGKAATIADQRRSRLSLAE